jgi:hypothetical protein
LVATNYRLPETVDLVGLQEGGGMPVKYPGVSHLCGAIQEIAASPKTALVILATGVLSPGPNLSAIHSPAAMIDCARPRATMALASAGS